MTIHTFYRLAVWLPLALPAAVAVIIEGLRTSLGPGVVQEVVGSGALQKIVQILLVSLLYGGPVYAPLAVWATWWIGGRTEAEIKRLMVRSPLLMMAAFVPVALLVGLIVGAPGPFAGVAMLGATMIPVVGYTYITLVMLMREELPVADAWPDQSGPLLGRNL